MLNLCHVFSVLIISDLIFVGVVFVTICRLIIKINDMSIVLYDDRESVISNIVD